MPAVLKVAESPEPGTPPVHSVASLKSPLTAAVHVLLAAWATETEAAMIEHANDNATRRDMIRPPEESVDPVKSRQDTTAQCELLVKRIAADVAAGSFCAVPGTERNSGSPLGWDRFATNDGRDISRKGWFAETFPGPERPCASLRENV